MEFSTQTTASLHQIKTSALAVGVFSDGQLSPAADIIDNASNGALRSVLKSEFPAKPNTHLVLRNLPGVNATRVILVGLGKPDNYNAAAHAGAEQVFANYCVQASLTEGVSTLAAIECTGSSLRQRAQASALAAGRATYRYDATL
jgi:leucyl aminopeptidase